MLEFKKMQKTLPFFFSLRYFNNNNYLYDSDFLLRLHPMIKFEVFKYFTCMSTKIQKVAFHIVFMKKKIY